MGVHLPVDSDSDTMYLTVNEYSDYSSTSRYPSEESDTTPDDSDEEEEKQESYFIEEHQGDGVCSPVEDPLGDPAVHMQAIKHVISRPYVPKSKRLRDARNRMRKIRHQERMERGYTRDSSSSSSSTSNGSSSATTESTISDSLESVSPTNSQCLNFLEKANVCFPQVMRIDKNIGDLSQIHEKRKVYWCQNDTSDGMDSLNDEEAPLKEVEPAGAEQHDDSSSDSDEENDDDDMDDEPEAEDDEEEEGEVIAEPLEISNPYYARKSIPEPKKKKMGRKIGSWEYEFEYDEDEVRERNEVTKVDCAMQMHRINPKPLKTVSRRLSLSKRGLKRHHKRDT